MIYLAGVLDGPDAEPLRERLRAEGRPLDEMRRLYAALDPSLDQPRISPERISVLYGKFDRQRRRWLGRGRGGVTRLLPYDRGHALALFTRRMYGDYARLLDEDLRALGQ